MCACQKSYTSIIITSITWAGPRGVQEAAAILGPQNRIQGRCDIFSIIFTVYSVSQKKCRLVEKQP